jgi:hypothetical protein
MVGLYETAIEKLCAREVEGRRVLPKTAGLDQPRAHARA